MAASLGVLITARGLSDRFTEPAASLLQQMLDAVVSQVMAADPVAIPILQGFTAAILLNSTVIVLPDALAGVWRGCGGNTPQRNQAAVKLQVSLDLLWGALHGPHLSDGRAHDSSSTLQKAALNKKSLSADGSGLFPAGRVRGLRSAGRLFSLTAGGCDSRVRQRGAAPRFAHLLAGAWAADGSPG